MKNLKDPNYVMLEKEFYNLYEKLDYNKEYKKVAEKMIGILRKEGLFSRWSDIKEIKEFQKKFNILSFEPKYFE